MKVKLNLTLTAEQKKQIKMLALEKDMNVSDYILSFLPIKKDENI